MTRVGACRWRLAAIFAQCVLALGLAAPANADQFPVGFLSLVTITPSGPSTAGTMGLQIANYTGDPAAGGWALPPDFPVFTAFTFQNLSFTYVVGGISLAVPVADLGPGATTAIELPDTTAVASASLTGTLPVTFRLFDGTDWLATSDSFSVVLLPSLGSTLTPDFDSAVLFVDANPTGGPAPVPEPAAAVLLITALAFVRLIRR